MPESRYCPDCGVQLPLGVSPDMCPKCLMGALLEDSSSAVDQAPPDEGPIDETIDSQNNLGGAPAERLAHECVGEETLGSDIVEAEPAAGTGPSSKRLARGVRIKYFGDYEIIEEIARGGMGVVYKARQVKLDRIVALKMIIGGQLADETAVQRFYTEAQAAAGLDHRGIVPIYEVGQHDGQHFFSMGLIEGESLAERLRDGPLPPQQAARLIQQTAEAVAYAHEQGVIHRDLKPANILLERHKQKNVSGSSTFDFGLADLRPKLTDFGLAKQTSEDSGMTATGQILGTPSFMPPEQAAGKTDEIGPLADVYSLGATLYATLTGRPPFQGASILDTIQQLKQQEPVPPRQLNASISRDLETICLKCLQKEPKRRYESAAVLVEELGRYLNGEPIEARPVSHTERTWRWCRRNPVIAGLSSAALLLLLACTTIIGALGWIAIEQADLARQKAAEAAEKAALAEDEGRRATEEAENAKEANAATEAQLQRSNWLLYASDIAGARREWELGDYVTARQLLGQSRKGFRGWEHDYLYTQHNYGIPLRVGSSTAQTDCVAISPDGTRVATCNHYDDAVRVWDAETGGEVARLPGHPPNVDSIAFHPTEPLLAVVSQDDSLRLWNYETCEEVWHSSEFTGPTQVFFAVKGQQVLTASHKNLTAYDIATGELLYKRAITDTSLKMTVSRDGKRMATVGRGTPITIWDTASRQTILKIENPFEDTPWVVALSHDAGRVAVARGNEIKVFHGEDGTVLSTLRHAQSNFMALAFRNGGQQLIVGGNVAGAQTWELGDAPSLDQSDSQEALRPLADREFRSSYSNRELAVDSMGRRLVIRSQHTAEVWDMVDRRLISECGGHGNSRTSSSKIGITTAGFSPDGKHAYTSDHSGTVKVWDPDDDRIIKSLSTFRTCTEPALNHDGKVAVAWTNVGMSRGIVRILDLESDQQVEFSIGVAATGLTFRPGYTQLAIAAYHKSARQYVTTLYDTTDGERVMEINDAQAPICFDPGGNRLAAMNAGGIHIWDLSDVDNSAPPFATQAGKKLSLAWSPDGKLLAVSGERRTEMWDVESRQLQYTIPGSAGELAFSPDGKSLARGAVEGIEFWNVESGLREFVLRGTEFVADLAFSPDGKWISSGDRIWPTNGSQEVVRFRFPAERDHSKADWREATVIAPSGCWIAGLFRQQIRVWNTTDWNEMFQIEADQSILCLAASGDDRQLAAILATGDAQIWNVETGQEVVRLEGTGKEVVTAEFSPDGTRIAIVHKDGWIAIWDAGTGSRIATVEPGSTDVIEGHQPVAFHPDSRQIAIGGEEQVRICDVRDGRELQKLQLPAYSGTTLSVDWSRDGRQLVAASHKTCVFDVATGEVVAVLSGGPDIYPTHICFSPDGRRVAAESSESIYLWDAASGQQVFDFPDVGFPEFGKVDLRFSTDGTRLIATSVRSGISACIWDASRTMPE